MRRRWARWARTRCWWRAASRRRSDTPSSSKACHTSICWRSKLSAYSSPCIFPDNLTQKLRHKHQFIILVYLYISLKFCSHALPECLGGRWVRRHHLLITFFELRPIFHHLRNLEKIFLIAAAICPRFIRGRRWKLGMTRWRMNVSQWIRIYLNIYLFTMCFFKSLLGVLVALMFCTRIEVREVRVRRGSRWLDVLRRKKTLVNKNYNIKLLIGKFAGVCSSNAI